MAQQATFGDTAFEVEIIAMTQELLTSGEIEQIIRRELLKGFERGIESAFQWGDLKKAINKRIADLRGACSSRSFPCRFRPGVGLDALF